MFKSKISLVLKKAKQYYFLLILIFIMNFMSYLDISSKQDSTFFIIKLVLSIIVLFSFIFVIIESILTIQIYPDYLLFSRGLSIIINKSTKIEFNKIISMKFIENGKPLLTPIFKSKTSKGMIVFTYSGKYKFEKKSFLIDLDIFVDNEELKKIFLKDIQHNKK